MTTDFSYFLQVIIILIFLNIFFFLFHKKIGQILNLYAQNINQIININLVPVIGGVFFFFNILAFFLLIFFLKINLNTSILNNEFLLRTKFFFFLSLILIFCVGLLDDKYNLSYRIKIPIFFIICYLPFSSGQLIIDSLNFIQFNKVINLENLSLVFSISSIFLFINIFNMYDGINGQAGIYILVISVYLLIIYKIIILVPLIITTFFFLLLNLRGMIFLGNNGSYFVSFYLGLILICNYKMNFDFKVEDIILITIYPALDTFRLFVTRIFYGKNPFLGDRNHLHHLLLDRFKSIFLVNVIASLHIITPLIINLFWGSLTAILISIFFYISFLYLHKKN